MTMSKTQTQKSEQPTFVEELLKNGTAVLSAPTRGELESMLSDIPADCHVAVGAVGLSSDGSTYSIRVDIIK